MTKLIQRLLLPSCLLMMSSIQANPLTIPMDENEFVKTFAGKSAEFVKDSLGEPDQISSKSNDSGKVEFWLYTDIVKVGKKDKTFKFTQIGIINNYVETMGNTNRSPL
jgi:hypothetical protein